MRLELLSLLVAVVSSTTEPPVANDSVIVDHRELEEAGWEDEGKRAVQAVVRRLLEDFQSSVKVLQEQEVTCKLTRQRQCRECVRLRCTERLEDLNCGSLSNRVRGALETVCRTAAEIPGLSGRLGGDHQYCTRLSGLVINTVGNVVHSITNIDEEFAERVQTFLVYGSLEAAERISETVDDILENVGLLLNRTGHDVDMDRVRTSFREGVTEFGEDVSDFFQEVPSMWNDVKTQARQVMSSMSDAMARWRSRFWSSTRSTRSRRSSPWLEEIEPTCSDIRWRPVRACMKYMAHCDTCTPVTDRALCPELGETEARVRELETQITCLRAVAQGDWSYSVDGMKIETDSDEGVALVSLFGRQGAVAVGEGENGEDLASNALAEYLAECTSSVNAYVRRLR